MIPRKFYANSIYQNQRKIEKSATFFLLFDNLNREIAADSEQGAEQKRIKTSWIKIQGAEQERI